MFRLLSCTHPQPSGFFVWWSTYVLSVSYTHLDVYKRQILYSNYHKINYKYNMIYYNISAYTKMYKFHLVHYRFYIPSLYKLIIYSFIIYYILRNVLVKIFMSNKRRVSFVLSWQIALVIMTDAIQENVIMCLDQRIKNVFLRRCFCNLW